FALQDLALGGRSEKGVIIEQTPIVFARKRAGILRDGVFVLPGHHHASAPLLFAGGGWERLRLSFVFEFCPSNPWEIGMLANIRRSPPHCQRCPPRSRMFVIAKVWTPHA